MLEEKKEDKEMPELTLDGYADKMRIEMDIIPDGKTQMKKLPRDWKSSRRLERE